MALQTPVHKQTARQCVAADCGNENDGTHVGGTGQRPPEWGPRPNGAARGCVGDSATARRDARVCAGREEDDVPLALRLPDALVPAFSQYRRTVADQPVSRQHMSNVAAFVGWMARMRDAREPELTLTGADQPGIIAACVYKRMHEGKYIAVLTADLQYHDIYCSNARAAHDERADVGTARPCACVDAHSGDLTPVDDWREEAQDREVLRRFPALIHA